MMGESAKKDLAVLDTESKRQSMSVWADPKQRASQGHASHRKKLHIVPYVLQLVRWRVTQMTLAHQHLCISLRVVGGKGIIVLHRVVHMVKVIRQTGR